MRLVRRFCLMMLAALLVFPAPLPAKEAHIPKTGDPAWDAFIDLQKKWTRQLHELVLEKKPEFKEIADLSYRWRLEDMRLETMKFNYLRKHQPETIQRDKGLPGFVKLSWFPDQAEKLRKASTEFEQQEKTVSVLKHQVESHPQWQALQDYLKALQKSPEQKQRFDRFLADMKQVQKILAQTAAEEMRRKQ